MTYLSLSQIIKDNMAPKGYKNRELLESLADVFEGTFWEIPGLTKTFANDGRGWKVRSDLGADFRAWLTKDVAMTINGVSLELDMATDIHRTRQWTEIFNAKALRRKYSMKAYYLYKSSLRTN